MKNLSILFIYPDIGTSSISFSGGIEILSSLLQKQGVGVNLLHLHEPDGEPFDIDIIHKKVNKIKPDLISFTATTHQYPISNKIAEGLKKRGVKTPIFLGGIHPTIAPGDLKDSSFDAFGIGEGELIMSEVFKRLATNGDISAVPGLHFKKGNEIIKNPYCHVIEDLDQLPFRDYEIINAKKLLKLRDNWLSISVSRGCPYLCNYCINEMLLDIHRKSSSGKYCRCQSVDRVIAELIHLIELYGDDIKVINFDDDLLLLNRKWFLEFTDRFQKEIFLQYGIMYAINGRADLIDEEIALKLKESGCYLMRVGFETGDIKLRDMVLGKKITNDSLYRAFELFQKYRIRSLAFTMLGIPGECKETVMLTIKMLRVIKPTLIRMSFFEPFRGSKMYDYCEKNNLLKKDYYIPKNYFTETSLLFEKISSFELSLYHSIFPWFLNVGFDNEAADAYQKLINKYSVLSEEELKLESTRAKILKDNDKISGKLIDMGVEHFTFFKNNKFYYQLKCGVVE